MGMRWLVVYGAWAVMGLGAQSGLANVGRGPAEQYLGFSAEELAALREDQAAFQKFFGGRLSSDKNGKGRFVGILEMHDDLNHITNHSTNGLGSTLEKELNRSAGVDDDNKVSAVARKRYNDAQKDCDQKHAAKSKEHDDCHEQAFRTFKLSLNERDWGAAHDNYNDKHRVVTLTQGAVSAAEKAGREYAASTIKDSKSADGQYLSPDKMRGEIEWYYKTQVKPRIRQTWKMHRALRLADPLKSPSRVDSLSTLISERDELDQEIKSAQGQTKTIKEQKRALLANLISAIKGHDDNALARAIVQKKFGSAQVPNEAQAVESIKACLKADVHCKAEFVGQQLKVEQPGAGKNTGDYFVDTREDIFRMLDLNLEQTPLNKILLQMNNLADFGSATDQKVGLKDKPFAEFKKMIEAAVKNAQAMHRGVERNGRTLFGGPQYAAYDPNKMTFDQYLSRQAAGSTMVSAADNMSGTIAPAGGSSSARPQP